jgi:hypothetical protein
MWSEEERSNICGENNAKPHGKRSGHVQELLRWSAKNGIK